MVLFHGGENPGLCAGAMSASFIGPGTQGHTPQLQPETALPSHATWHGYCSYDVMPGTMSHIQCLAP